ncbi:MAG: hypothetical protein IKO76_06695 [Butyrivibrio sp.]|nr:hypothetical protein [Butyrivibrio sp.]
MICPFCGGRSGIMDCRQRKKYKYRLHICRTCGRHFATHEVYAEDYTGAKPEEENE